MTGKPEAGWLGKQGLLLAHIRSMGIRRHLHPVASPSLHSFSQVLEAGRREAKQAPSPEVLPSERDARQVCSQSIRQTEHPA